MRKSFLKYALKKFFARRIQRFAVIFVGLLFLTAIFAPLIAGNKPYFIRYQGKNYFPAFTSFFTKKKSAELPFNANEYRVLAMTDKNLILMPPIPFSPTEHNLEEILMPPSQKHWMGTDDQGRDVASRMVHGARVSLSVGFVAVGIYLVIGLTVGSLAGYFGGKFDLFISRFIEIVMCFPTFFLILTVLTVIGPSLYNIMLVIGLTNWTGIARLVRAEFLKLKNQDFVTSARVLGFSRRRVIFGHIFPNALTPVLVSVTFGIAGAILTESSLSFLGFGVQPPTPSWGDILSSSREFLDIAWWLMLYPGLAIFVSVLSLNFVGEGLRDALDPRAK